MKKKEVAIGLVVVVILAGLLVMHAHYNKKGTTAICTTEKIEADTKHCIEKALKDSDFEEPEAILYIQDRCEKKAEKFNCNN